MGKFVLAYKGGGMAETPEAQEAAMKAWMDWFGAGGQDNTGALSTNITTSNFGVITGARAGRIVQLGAKLLW